MATASISNTVHTSVEVTVTGLQTSVSNYDKFVFRFSQNGTQVLAYTWYGNGITYTSFALDFVNSSYLGNNYFAPSTTYSVIVDCYYNGVCYSLDQVVFTTNSISPPTGSITPYVYPVIKNQYAFGNCVAMSLSTAMEIFKAKAVGTSSSYENFSVSYIFGSDRQSYDYMMFEGAVDLCKTYGSPRWELVTTLFPDSKSKSDSVNIFNGASSIAKQNAVKQCFTGSTNIDFYDCASVASAIQNYGYFMMNFRIPNNFYNISSDGIVPQPSGGYSGSNHSIALIGLTTINNKKYWIAQNSWGTSFGKNGLCYIPYDWGCGVQSPQGSSNTSDTCGWTCDCYSVWNGNVLINNPQPPTLTSVAQIGITKNATLNWAIGTIGSSIQIYARKLGTNDWWPKPSYGTLFSGTSTTISFDNNNNTYEIMALSIKDGLVSLQSNIITVGISILWDWNISNGSATGLQTRTAYSAIAQKRELYWFSYLVWNDLVDKIYKVIQEQGLSWSANYIPLDETKMTSSDKVMTAKRFNSARYNIGVHYSTGIQEVFKGDIMYGSYFITLATKLNEWINTLS